MYMDHNSSYTSSFVRLSHALHSTAPLIQNSVRFIALKEISSLKWQSVKACVIHHQELAIPVLDQGQHNTTFKCSHSVSALGIRPSPKLVHRMIRNRDLVFISMILSLLIYL